MDFFRIMKLEGSSVKIESNFFVALVNCNYFSL
jgi:hypothetical protein